MNLGFSHWCRGICSLRALYNGEQYSSKTCCANPAGNVELGRTYCYCSGSSEKLFIGKVTATLGLDDIWELVATPPISQSGLGGYLVARVTGHDAESPHPQIGFKSNI